MRTIVWDIDDVLNDLMRSWFEQRWLRDHPGSSIGYRDLVENPPYRLLNMTAAEYFASLDEYRASGDAAQMAPNPAVLSWLRASGASFRHVALTARPMLSAPEAAAWLFRHFGEYFRCFGVVPARPGAALPVYDRDKGEFLRWLKNADFFVDDSEENIAAAERLGVRTILYPQPWNGSNLTIPDVLQQFQEEQVLTK